MAQLIIQPATGCSYIMQLSANDNFNSQTALLLGCYTSQKIRGIVKFDVSGVPAGATIDAATLSLCYYSKINESSGWSIDFSRNTRTNWVDSQVTWNSYSTGNTWTAAGSDYTTDGEATSTVPASYGWMSWNVKDLTVDAIANRSNILTGTVKYDNETTTQFKQIYFYSSTYTYDTALRPKLVIDYTQGGWSNISKLNGIAAASIAKYNGVAVASVAKINGVAV